MTYVIVYVLTHHMNFWLDLYILNNILYFYIKYSCASIFHRRSLYTFYWGRTSSSSSPSSYSNSTRLIIIFILKPSSSRGHTISYHTITTRFSPCRLSSFWDDISWIRIMIIMSYHQSALYHHFSITYHHHHRNDIIVIVVSPSYHPYHRRHHSNSSSSYHQDAMNTILIPT